MTELIKINRNELEPYIPEMLKAGLCFAKKTHYYKIMVHDELVGFTGIIWFAKKARFKNSYIFERFRRKGYYSESKELLIKIAGFRGITMFDAIVTDMSKGWFIKNGFTIIRHYKNLIHFEKQYKV